MTTRAVVPFLIAVLTLQPFAITVAAQSVPQGPPVEGTRARLQAFLAGRNPVEVALRDGTTVRGRIVSAGDSTFTVLEDATRRESTWGYLEVTSVDTISWNRRRTAVALAITGSVFAVLCFAPFPLGFLCRDDPS